VTESFLIVSDWTTFSFHKQR